MALSPGCQFMCCSVVLVRRAHAPCVPGPWFNSATRCIELSSGSVGIGQGYPKAWLHACLDDAEGPAVRQSADNENRLLSSHSPGEGVEYETRMLAVGLTYVGFVRQRNTSRITCRQSRHIRTRERLPRNVLSCLKKRTTRGKPAPTRTRVGTLIPIPQAYNSEKGQIHMGQLKAGTGKTDITPNLGCHLVGYFNDRLADSIHDPLYVKALALQAGDRTLGLVTCDLIGVPTEVVEAAAGPLKGILRAADEPIVSSDIIGENHSSVVDLQLISQVAPTFFRVVGWYDNENAYSVRCVDLLEYMVAEEKA